MQQSDNNQIYYNISLLNASIYVENGVAYKMCLMKQSSKPSVKKKINIPYSIDSKDFNEDGPFI